MLEKWDSEGLTQTDEEGNQTAPGTLEIITAMNEKISNLEDEVEQLRQEDRSTPPSVQKVSYDENGDVVVSLRFPSGSVPGNE